MFFLLNIKTVSEANLREHWAQKARRAKTQRGAACLCIKARLPFFPLGQEPKEITLIRVAPRELDSDNLAGALKAIRDGIADALWPNIVSQLRDKVAIWRYEQRKGGVGEYAVEVEF